MSNYIKDATTRFHFNELDQKATSEWAKTLVLNNVSIYIWAKGGEQNPLKFLPHKFDPQENKLWLNFKSSMFEKAMPSDLVGSDVFIKAEWEKVYLFGQTILEWDKKEKLHYLTLEGKFYKSQQREQLRVKAMPRIGIVIKLQIGEKEYEGFDISFGGTSFFSNEEFKIGQILEKLNIIVVNDSFFIPKAKVVKIFPDKDEKGRKKIAINFVKLEHDTEISLTKKVEILKKSIEKKKIK